MKVLFLYAEVTGYLMACLKALERHPAISEIRVYQGLDLPETGYDFASGGIRVCNAIGRTAAELWAELESYEPDVVYVSGWAFPEYLKLAAKFRKRGATTVIGNDTPWYGTFRQWLGVLSSPFWLRPAFDWMWVPGQAQHRFARRLSFPARRIATGLLSADVAAFQQPLGKPAASRTLLSAGSFLPNKGMDRILTAFEALVDTTDESWSLLLVGSYAGNTLTSRHPRVRIVPFVQPQHMPALLAQADAFVLASWRESWGVAVHEAAAAGLPLLLSNRVGAAEAFLRNRYNGWLFDPFSDEDLRAQMQVLLQTPPTALQEMGQRSASLARQQNPDIWAQTLVNMRLDARS